MGRRRPAAELALEQHEPGIGREPEKRQKQDRRIHQRNLEIVLSVHHLKADTLIGADHLGSDEQQKRGGGREAKADENGRD